MRAHHRQAACAIALSLAVSLGVTGCAPDAAIPTPPEPTVEPIFASEEEALAAAEEAYRAYIAAADEVAADGGTEPERILPFVAKESHEERLAESAPYRERQLHTVGTTQVSSAILQQHWQEGQRAHVEIYACLDLSAVRVVNVNGDDVTPTRDAAAVPFTVSLRSADDAPARLVLVESELWSGPTRVC